MTTLDPAGAVLFLVEESTAMDALMPGGTRKKSESVATAINALFNQLTHTPKILVSLVGYRLGTSSDVDVGTRWGGALAGRDWVHIAELSDSPIRVEERARASTTPGGPSTVSFPIWYDPKTTGSKSPQIAAFTHCQDLLSILSTQHTSLRWPALILHLCTSNASADGNPTKAVQQIQEMQLPGGSPLVYQLHLASSEKVPTTRYPGNRAYLPLGTMRDLFERCSRLPTELRASLKAEKMNVNPRARGLVYHARMAEMIQFLSLVKAYVATEGGGTIDTHTPPRPGTGSGAGAPRTSASLAPPPQPGDVRQRPTGGGPPLPPSFPGAPRTPSSEPVASEPSHSPPEIVTPVEVDPSPPFVEPVEVIPSSEVIEIKEEPKEAIPPDLSEEEDDFPQLELDNVPKESPPPEPDSTFEDLMLDPLPTEPPADLEQTLNPVLDQSAGTVDRGLLLILLDRSVTDPFGGTLNGPCQRLQDRINEMLDELGSKPIPSLDVSLLTFGTDINENVEIRASFENDPAERQFLPSTELAECAIRVEEFEQKMSDGIGGIVTLNRKKSIYLETEPTISAPLTPAIQRTKEIIERWRQMQVQPGRVVVLHCARGEGYTSQPVECQQELESLSQDVGIVLYNLLATESPLPSTSYLDSSVTLDSLDLQELWSLSSPLLAVDQLTSRRPGLTVSARGFVVNGKMDLLIPGLELTYSGN